MAERYFREPNQESFDAFMATCMPLYNPTPSDPDVRARIRLRPEVNFHFARDEFHTYDWFGDLDRIRCPTLILAGQLDPIATVADHQEMAALIQVSQLEVFQDAGHGVFRDKPGEALGVIRNFVLGGDVRTA